MENNISIQQKSKGEFRDIIHHADGSVEVTEWSRNVIVNDVHKAIAFALAQKGGATYWAIGSGLETWDNETPPPPQATDTQLVNEIGRKPIGTSNIKFVDTNGDITQDITNTIQISLVFDVNECNGSWREFAIVGGNATTEANTGILINHKTHGLVRKSDNMQVERQMRFTFN